MKESTEKSGFAFPSDSVALPGTGPPFQLIGPLRGYGPRGGVVQQQPEVGHMQQFSS